LKRDPSDLLSAWGYRLEHHRDRLTAYWHGDERYRLTRTPEGIWQWVDRYGNPGATSSSSCANSTPRSATPKPPTGS